MAIVFKKKSSNVFSPPSYIKGGIISESKVEKIINETIKEKIFNLLDINRTIYLKKIEYFPIFTIEKETGEKILKSLMLRVKNKQFRFREMLAKEIELSGINVIEFNQFLEDNGATEIYDFEKQLQNL